MPLTLTATIKVDTGRSKIEMKCASAESLADDALHILIQAIGTKKAREFAERKFKDYLPDYGGLDAPVPPLAIPAETTP